MGNNVNNSHQTSIVLAKGSHKYHGTAIVRFPIHNRWLELEVNLLTLYLSLLLSLRDMDRLGIYFMDLSNKGINKALNDYTAVMC